MYKINDSLVIHICFIFFSSDEFVAKDHSRFLRSKTERTKRVLFNMFKFWHGSLNTPDEVSVRIDYLFKIIHSPMLTFSNCIVSNCHSNQTSIVSYDSFITGVCHSHSNTKTTTNSKLFHDIVHFHFVPCIHYTHTYTPVVYSLKSIFIIIMNKVIEILAIYRNWFIRRAVYLTTCFKYYSSCLCLYLYWYSLLLDGHMIIEGFVCKKMQIDTQKKQLNCIQIQLAVANWSKNIKAVKNKIVNFFITNQQEILQ